MDLDTALRRLAEDPVPLRLNAVEDQVIERVAVHRFGGTGESLQVRVALVTVALLMGIAGGMVSDAAAQQQPKPALLAGIEDIAPSSLLSEAR